MTAVRKRKPRKDTSFATWKFELENTVNADPQTDGACLQVLRAYLDFMGDAQDRPFMSITNLKVATALHEGAIVRARRRLVKLQYFVDAGYTSAHEARGRYCRDNHRLGKRQMRRRPSGDAAQMTRDPELLIGCKIIGRFMGMTPRQVGWAERRPTAQVINIMPVIISKIAAEPWPPKSKEGELVSLRRSVA